MWNIDKVLIEKDVDISPSAEAIWIGVVVATYFNGYAASEEEMPIYSTKEVKVMNR